MDLNILWFILVTVLFIGFFFLEGFDYGVGMLNPLVAKNDTERRIVLNTFGPFWDGNEVWLLTAGGAIFAAFPNWYATLFSGFYLALFLVLLTLIVRCVGIEVRSKKESQQWRNTWDLLIAISSFLSAFLWGVAVSNLMTGVPIDADMQFAGNFFTLLTPFTIFGGVVFVLLFAFHGALFLKLKAGSDAVLNRVKALADKLGLVLVVAVVIWVVLAYLLTDVYSGVLALVLVALAAVALVASVVLQLKDKKGFSFIAMFLAILCVTASVFAGMFPNVMISTLDPSWSLTIYNASSSPYTLKIMTIVAFTLVPIVLLYQSWNYYVFRKRVTAKDVKY